MFAPLLDDDGGLLQAVEDLAIEKLVTQLAVEGLAIAILPGASGFGIERSGTNVANQLRTIFAVISAPLSDRTCSGTPRVSITLAMVSMTPKLLIRRATGSQGIPGQTRRSGHQPKLAPIVSRSLDKVVATDMIAMLRPQSNTRSAV